MALGERGYLQNIRPFLPILEFNFEPRHGRRLPGKPFVFAELYCFVLKTSNPSRGGGVASLPKLVRQRSLLRRTTGRSNSFQAVSVRTCFALPQEKGKQDAKESQARKNPHT